MSGHIVQRGSVTSIGANQKAIGAIGTYEGLRSRQAERSVRSLCLGARFKQIVAVGAFLQRWHDQDRAGHRLFQLRMRRVPLRQSGCRNCCKPDRLADEPSPRLLEHQSEFGEAQTEAIYRTWNKNAKPPKLPRLPQPLRREAQFALTKAARDFRPGGTDELCGAVAQQNL